MNIGKAMMQLREEAGLSRREMAAKLGIQPTSLWKIDNGRVEPKTSTIARFCEIIGTPIAYLYIKAFTIEDFLPVWRAKPVLKVGDLLGEAMSPSGLCDPHSPILK